MNAIDQHSSISKSADTPRWRFAAAASILGWVLDAIDFFVVVFLLTELAAKFYVGKPAIVWCAGHEACRRFFLWGARG
jgi:MFS transporter, SHS family, lactate transporter